MSRPVSTAHDETDAGRAFADAVRRVRNDYFAARAAVAPNASVEERRIIANFDVACRTFFDAFERRHALPYDGDDDEYDEDEGDSSMDSDDGYDEAISGESDDEKELQFPERTVSAVEVDRVCAICLGEAPPGDKLRVLPCTHDFHLVCLDQWLRVSTLCPLCKDNHGPKDDDDDDDDFA